MTMQFPIVPRTPVFVAPRATAVYYEVAQNGVFQVRDTPIYRAVTPVEGPIPGLVPESENLVLKHPRLPRAELAEVLAFFNTIYRRTRGEAIVVLFYRHENREFRFDAPHQVLPAHRGCDRRLESDLSVSYREPPRPEGFCRLGTIHSHADSPASASPIDCDDERWEDGLHVIFGNFGSSCLSASASFVANGVRFPVSPAEVLEPCAVPDYQPRADWMERVSVKIGALDSMATQISQPSAIAISDDGSPTDSEKQS
jgi:hypothetical protein